MSGFTNIVSYGYDDDEQHRIRIGLGVDADDIIVRIEDDAKPFNPLGQAPKVDAGASIDQRGIGGLGLHLIREYTNRQHYERLGDKNRLTLRMAKNAAGGKAISIFQCSS